MGRVWMKVADKSRKFLFGGEILRFTQNDNAC